MPCSRSAASRMSYAMVPPSVPTRRPREIGQRAEARGVGGRARSALRGTRSTESWTPSPPAAPACPRCRSGRCRRRRARWTDRWTRTPTKHELRRAPEAARDAARRSRRRSRRRVGMVGIGFDKRRAAFGIAGPAQFTRSIGPGARCREQHQHRGHDERPRDCRSAHPGLRGSGTARCGGAAWLTGTSSRPRQHRRSA